MTKEEAATSRPSKWPHNHDRVARPYSSLCPACTDGVAVAQPTALERFNRDPDLLANEIPLERLRYFLSLALNGQDWLDVEPFLDALGVEGASK